MDNLIKELRKKPFSGEDILDVCNHKTKIITYPSLYKYNNLDNLFSPFDSAVILYETKPCYGHWVCLLRNKNTNTCEFFDPYGLNVDDQLKFIDMDFRIQNNEKYPILTYLLLHSPYKIIYNNTRLQKLSDDISSCGRHVSLRISLSYIPLDKYIKLLTHSKFDPDTVVTYLTAFI